ncbi:hypothetical protein [Colwellia ponticola]|uniref:Uncharacterized protein n=1 Tax=Colwellia ponticola TaxID=2304625 RepID=A0A8H2JRD9_9GAMM|nr:hypothetical protein [Colwellia ponticola]TMM46855.1 hypothetical protein FCS21_03495 [Colwellia ponticola]
MPFLYAIFCLKGFDNRHRFFVTSLVAFISFIVTSTLLFSDFTLNFIVLLLLTIVIFFSTTRRLRDADITKKWQLVLAGLFLLTGLLTLLIENNSSYYLLILPALICALLLTYPSNSKVADKHYILGYYGPVNLSDHIKKSDTVQSHKVRIEPTLMTQSTGEQCYSEDFSTGQRSVTTEQNVVNTEQVSDNLSDGSLNSNSHNNWHNKKTDIGELIRLKLLGNRNFQLSAIAGVTLIALTIIVMSAFNAISPSDSSHEKLTSAQNSSGAESDITNNFSNSISANAAGENAIKNIVSNKKHLLMMPDNFNLYLSVYQGIIIHWKADQAANGQLWSLLSGSGDKSCQTISFNKGEAIRPIGVLVDNGSDYFASFSPLDSKELIQALAFRGNFSLCGYNFSLKGSQAVLGKNSQYAPFLEKDA